MKNRKQVRGNAAFSRQLSVSVVTGDKGGSGLRRAQSFPVRGDGGSIHPPVPRANATALDR
jgi:hypothetical protein